MQGCFRRHWQVWIKSEVGTLSLGSQESFHNWFPTSLHLPLTLLNQTMTHSIRYSRLILHVIYGMDGDLNFASILSTLMQLDDTYILFIEPRVHQAMRVTTPSELLNFWCTPLASIPKVGMRVSCFFLLYFLYPWQWAHTRLGLVMIAQTNHFLNSMHPWCSLLWPTK